MLEFNKQQCCNIRFHFVVEHYISVLNILILIVSWNCSVMVEFDVIHDLQFIEL